MVAKSYFEELFAATAGTYEPVTTEVNHRVSVLDNERLLAPFSKEDFRTALFQIYSDKSLGHDGLNPAFNQKLWSTLSDDIFKAGKTWLSIAFSS